MIFCVKYSLQFFNLSKPYDHPVVHAGHRDEMQPREAPPSPFQQPRDLVAVEGSPEELQLGQVLELLTQDWQDHET